MCRARLIPLLIFLTEPTVAAAQWKLAGDVGYSHVEQPELPTSGATTAALTFDFAREHSLFHMSALGAQTPDGRQTGQWLTVGSLISPSWKQWSLQTTGMFSAFGQTTLSATTSRDFLAQLRTGSVAQGLAIGGGLGTTIHNAVAIPNRRGQLDGWLMLARERLSANVALTRTRSVFGGSSILVDISRRNLNYLDLSGDWEHDAGAWSVAATAGVRGRNATFGGGNSWQAIDATLWLDRHVAFVFDAGRTLEDLVRGVPRSRYVSIALRIESQPHLTLMTRRPTAGPRATVARAGDARRIEITNVAVTRVELMADFTDWNPVPLDSVGRSWRLDQNISAGLHRLVIRIDGGDWTVPANLPHIEDDVVGPVGLITVP